jgi:hypothetical protein
MRDYKRLTVYHLLDQLILDAYEAMRTLPPNERCLTGTPLLQAFVQAIAAVIHGSLARNQAARLPYVEKAHAHAEEAGQHLRMLQRLGLIGDEPLAVLNQRQQACVRLLLQWRQTIFLNLEQQIDDDEDVWTIAEEPAPAKAKPGRPRLKKYPTLS